MTFSVKRYELVAVLVAALLVGAVGLTWGMEKNGAEELFTKMEEKLLKADTLQVTLQTSIKRPEEVEIKAAIFLQEGNKARMEMDYGALALPLPPTIISNGTKWKGIAPGVHLSELDTPSNLNRILTLAVTRGGTTAIVYWLRSPERKAGEEEPDPETWLCVSEFTLGNQEEINGHHAQAIHFKLESGTIRTSEAMVTLWLDRDTLLPIRRVFVSVQGDGESTTTETFHDLKLNEKIASSQFELPGTFDDTIHNPK